MTRPRPRLERFESQWREWDWKGLSLKVKTETEATKTSRPNKSYRDYKERDRKIWFEIDIIRFVETKTHRDRKILWLLRLRLYRESRWPLGAYLLKWVLFCIILHKSNVTLWQVLISGLFILLKEQNQTSWGWAESSCLTKLLYQPN